VHVVGLPVELPQDRLEVDTEVRRRAITLAKLTPEREWLGEAAIEQFAPVAEALAGR
jgi:hypothetical protein